MAWRSMDGATHSWLTLQRRHGSSGKPEVADVAVRVSSLPVIPHGTVSLSEEQMANIALRKAQEEAGAGEGMRLALEVAWLSAQKEAERLRESVAQFQLAREQQASAEAATRPSARAAASQAALPARRQGSPTPAARSEKLDWESF